MGDRDLDKSFQRLQMFDIDEKEDVEACQGRWIEEVMTTLNCDDESQLKMEKFMAPTITKKVLARWLEKACKLIVRQRELQCNMTEIVELQKTEELGNRGKIIQLQSELLDSKNEQLKNLQSAVQSTVQDTVQAEMRCYTDVVKNVSGSSSISPEALKKVVQTAIVDDDRSRNLLVFGLKEEDGENVEEKITEVLQEVGEKPRLEATRLGRRGSGPGNSCRPVKVTVASSTTVRQILMNARNLRQVERYKSVYICPDRSLEERASQRKLVLELKKISTEQPHLHHYIRGGKVCSGEKNGTGGS
jgi:hypothetical protein